MKKIITSLFIASILISCKSNTDSDSQSSLDSTSPPTETPSEEATIDYVAIDNDEALIATALMAAPKESRMDSKVIGYNMAGNFVTLKEGTNEFICLADDPNKDGFSAASYHKDLEPFMARGRELKAEGKSFREIFDTREEEVKSGKLSMGKMGSTLHIYHGPNATYDPETSMVDDANYRYVVYMPFATAESTGLPEVPLESNHPWIMNPGTHRAHIMITPLIED